MTVEKEDGRRTAGRWLPKRGKRLPLEWKQEEIGLKQGWCWLILGIEQGSEGAVDMKKAKKGEPKEEGERAARGG